MTEKQYQMENDFDSTFFPIIDDLGEIDHSIFSEKWIDEIYPADQCVRIEAKQEYAPTQHSLRETDEAQNQLEIADRSLPFLDGGMQIPVDDFFCDIDDEDYSSDENSADRNANSSRRSKKRQRSKGDKPNYEIGLNEAVERNLKLLNIESNSKEGKNLRRRIRNRMSAQLHRERKRDYITTLEDQVKERDQRIAQLSNQVRLLTTENDRLRARLNIPAGNFETISCAGTTTSGSDSDSSLSTDSSKQGSDGKFFKKMPSGSQFGSGFSLLSLVLMVGMSLWSSPLGVDQFDMNPIAVPVRLNIPEDQSVTESSSINSRRLFISSDDHPSEVLERDVLPIISPLGSVGISSAALLSKSNALQLAQNVQVKEIQAPSGEFSPGSALLWQYYDDDRLAQIFPHVVNWASSSKISDRNSVSTTSENGTIFRQIGETNQATRRHLRKRVEINTGNSSISQVFMKKAQSAGGKDITRDENVLNVDLPSYSQIQAYSTILMKEGKVLLDPSLAMFTRYPSKEGMETLKVKSKEMSSDLSTKSVVVPLASNSISTRPFVAGTSNEVALSNLEGSLPALRLTSVAIDSDKGTGSSALALPRTSGTSLQTYPLLTIGPESQGFASASTARSTMPSTAADIPMLMMLLPASAIRWGKSWEDSVSRSEPLESFIRDLNKSNEEYAPGDLHNENNFNRPIDESSLWIEIGCSVFKAQLLKNVTLI